MSINAASYGEKFDDITDSISRLLGNVKIKEGTLQKSFLDEIDEFKKRGFLTVAFVGEYSAGKSTIISALTGRGDIKISADIATDKAQEYKWHGIHVIDTPGLWTERKEHDETTMQAIARADLLVYCLTYSLFDTTTLANFRHLAFDLNYQKKMMLLVNKMSAEAGDDNEKVINYTSSLSSSFLPNRLSDFSLFFCDARDYIDGKSEGNDELVALSRFTTFTEGLNKFVEEKGAVARLDTPLRICKSYLDEAADAALRSDSEDGVYSQLLTKFNRSIERNRRALRSEADTILVDLESKICKLGRDLAQDIGISETLKSDVENSSAKIQAYCDLASEGCEKAFDEARKSLEEDLESDFNSPLMSCYLENFKIKEKQIIDDRSVVAMSLKETVGSLNNIANKLGIPIRNMAHVKNATDLLNPGSAAGSGLSKASAVSGSLMHEGIKSAGKLVGYKFKPWQAVNLAKNLSNAIAVVGVVISIASLFSEVSAEAEQADNEKKISQAKKDLINQFQNEALDIKKQFKCFFESNEAVLFDDYSAEIAAMRTRHEELMSGSNEVIFDISVIRKEISVLQSQIS